MLRAVDWAMLASSARLLHRPVVTCAAAGHSQLLAPTPLLCPLPGRSTATFSLPARTYSRASCLSPPPASSPSLSAVLTWPASCTRHQVIAVRLSAACQPAFASAFSQRAADGSVVLAADDVNDAFEVLYPTPTADSTAAADSSATTASSSSTSSSSFPVLLTCEHASAVMPEPYALPLGDASLQGSHWQVDLGASELTRELSAALRCPALLSRCSRLVVDVNRPLQSDTLMRPMADGRVVELNHNLTPHQFEDRITRFYLPYHRRMRQLVQQHQPVLALSIHSFTPTYEGHSRSVQVGVLYRRAQDQPHAQHLLSLFRAAGVVCELNAPWSGLEGFMYAMDSLTQSHPTSSPILAPNFTTAAVSTHSLTPAASTAATSHEEHTSPPTPVAASPPPPPPPPPPSPPTAAAGVEVDAAALRSDASGSGAAVSPSLTLMLECRQDLLADAQWRQRCVDVIHAFTRTLTTQPTPSQ